MDIKQLIRKSISIALKQTFSIDVEYDQILVERPANSSWGDYSTNIALKLSKDLSQAPYDIANKLSYGIKAALADESLGASIGGLFSEVSSASNGFINMKISKEWLNKLLSEISVRSKNYGSSDLGSNETLIVEFSQANSNKPLHIGHARNNFIGSSLSNIYKFLGYNVIRANYIGDIGIHICKSMLMYLKHGHGKDPDKKPDHFIGDYYIQFEKEAEDNKELLVEAQELLRRWEAKDPEILALWEKMNQWVYEGWEETFKTQNVTFDVLEYESNCIDLGKDIVDIAVAKGIAEQDESGAIIARLEKYDLPDKVLLRSDGTSLYSTKDLQLALDSWNKYHFWKRLYVVDVRQSDYFKQVFKILEVLGFDWSNRLVHVPYGFVTLPEGKMSSRKGLVINSDDVFTTIKELEASEISKSLKDIPDKDSVASKVALAAFRYGLLKVDTKQDLVFDYSLVTKFDGNTGPYLMYTFARTQSVLGRILLEDKDKFVEVSNVSMDQREYELARLLHLFPEIIADAGDKRAPNILCNYLFDVAQSFNSFYAENSVVNASSGDLRVFRAQLTHAVSIVLKNGLDLLGIPVVERM